MVLLISCFILYKRFWNYPILKMVTLQVVNGIIIWLKVSARLNLSGVISVRYFETL